MINGLSFFFVAMSNDENNVSTTTQISSKQFDSDSLPSWMTSSTSTQGLREECPPSHRKWVVIGACASVTTAIVTLLWPFVSPALRRVCLPYVPATPTQVGRLECACLLVGLSQKNCLLFDCVCVCVFLCVCLSDFGCF